MGREFFYCFRCQARLEGEDLDAGRAARVREKVVCEKCLGDVIAPLSFKEQEQILLQVKTARDNATRERKESAPPKKGSTSTRLRIPPQIRSGGPPAPVTLPPSAHSGAGAAIFVVGAIVLLAGVAALTFLVGGDDRPLDVVRRPESSGSLEPAHVKVYKSSEPSPSTPPSPKEEKAIIVLEQARHSTRSTASLEQQVELFKKAAAASEGTALSPVARKELEDAEERLKDAIRRDFAQVEGDVQAACKLEEFAHALQLLNAAKIRRTSHDWEVQIEGRIRDLNARDAMNAFRPLRDQALEAKKRNDSGEVKVIADRIAKWGLPSFLHEFERAVGPIPGGSPASAQADLGPLSPEARSYQKAWDDALAPAASRDYDAAIAALQRAQAKVAEADLKSEARADLEALKLAAAAYRETLQVLLQWPRGEKLTVEFLDENLQPVRLSEPLVRADRTALELQQGNDVVVVELSEITARSLADLFKNRAEKKAESDARAAAILCLLEGDSEGARAALGGAFQQVPPKYWSRATRVAESRSRGAGKKEAEARRLYFAAERERQKTKTRGAAVEKYRQLLNEYADTALVQAKHAHISAQRESAKDYVFLAEDLTAGGTFKAARYAKIGPSWTSDADTTPPKSKENVVDFTFYAFPDTPYRCWVYVGGCCAETFTFYMQTTDFTYTDPKSKQTYLLEPGAGVSLPVNHSILSLKGRHEMHGGPKEPRRWEWVSIPLPPKYPTAGMKTVRILTETKGFSVACACVSATRQYHPGDTEMKALLRPPEEKPTSAPVDSAVGPASPPPTIEQRDPSLVGHWKLDDAGGTALDSSGNDNTGILVGDPPRGPGKFGTALVFDGKDRYVKIPPSPTIDKVQEGTFTLMAWFRPNTKPAASDASAKDGAYAIFMKAGVEGLRYGSDQRFRMDHGLGGNATATAVSGEPYAPGAFYHVAAVVSRSEGVVRLYVNGKQDGQAPIPSGAPARDLGSEMWKIGIAEPGRWAADGAIDEVRLYNRALAASEIVRLSK